MFTLTCFLLASVFYHYSLPNKIIHSKITLRGYLFFISSENSEIIKYFVVHFTWGKTV